ncbi:MAG: SIMPL domain-containing protein [Candidatus Caldarchaeales archaeon]
MSRALDLALIAAIVVLAFGLVVLASGDRTVQVVSRNEGKDYTITVTGSASARVVPDEARVIVGVVAKAQSASEAMGLASEAANRVISALTRLGLREGDLKTVRLHVGPYYDCSSGRCVQSGYVANNMIEVTLRGAFVGRAGEVLDAAVNAGANEIFGVSFYVSKEMRSQMAKDLLRAAVSDARAKAEQVARELGLRVVGVSWVSVDLQEPLPQAVPAEGVRAAPETVPVMPGEQEFRVTVSVSFRIGD